MKYHSARVLAFSLLAATTSDPVLADLGATYTFTKHQFSGGVFSQSNFFGFSTATSGNKAVIGAPFHQDTWGEAYLFDTTTGDPLFKLTAPDPTADDAFGRDVDISGTTAIVSARLDDDGGLNAGAAYVFDTTTGARLFKLTASDAERANWFGTAVAMSGTTAIVGAEGNDSAAVNAGAVYLFDTTTGHQLSKLTASDAAAHDQFGMAAAVSGNTAIVGAYADDDNGSSSGSAYLFDITTGNQLHKLTASDGAAEDYFGRYVDISGNLAIVSAHSADGVATNAGAAYIFDVNTGKQIRKLTAYDAAEHDRFGNGSVSISGNTAVVTAAGASGWSRSRRTYVFDVTTGNLFGRIEGGSAAELAGSTLIVGDRSQEVANLYDMDKHLAEPEHGTLEFEVEADTSTTITDLIAMTSDLPYQNGVVGYLFTGPDANLFSIAEYTDKPLLEDGGNTALYDLYFSGEDPGEYEATLTMITYRDENYEFGVRANVVPEPTSLALLGLGGLLIARRRR